MANKSIVSIVSIGLLSIWFYPLQLLAQVSTGVVKNSPATYENDRIKVVIQDCNRKLQELICQAVLTSKSSDRTIDLNGETIKLVDFEGNEYYPTSLRVANRVSENNFIKTELIENVPFKASFIFGKAPANLTQIALLQIPLSGGITATAKFRNFAIGSSNNAIAKPAPAKSPIPITSSVKIDAEVGSDNSLICPDNTKVLYRATSKNYLMYICGAKNPTHYVGLSKDGSQGITLRLRYYDRTQFSADNGDTNYTIAADRLIIRKDSKIVYQEKIQVLQPLAGRISVEDPTPKTPPKKSPSVSNNTSQKRSSTSQSPSKIKRVKTNGE
ncbi:hypothetical protein [Chamaesiphon sp. VAR_48_metabat_135_sub]|uniref:hypothetical protein n=1 Tax=Chamaesiphon sp. VAR_48_metabat_135_sub TaxID=2964699 RepID=UPI00286AF5DE|nr:hypothetical protein [Chamaesiphon sp. VAR_48_metabat_135_sub]